MNRILLELRDLPDGPSTRTLTEDVDSLDLHWGEYVFHSPVRIDLDVDKSEQEIAVAGRAVVPAQVECARCLRLFATEIKAGFKVRYVRTKGDPGKENDAPDEGLYHIRYDATTLDLTEEVRQALLVSLPIRALCRAACKGLCPTCGADLNERACSCDAPAGHAAWSALRKLQDGREPDPRSGN